MRLSSALKSPSLELITTPVSRVELMRRGRIVSGLSSIRAWRSASVRRVIFSPMSDGVNPVGL
jgi:hypothetical protein